MYVENKMEIGITYNNNPKSFWNKVGAWFRRWLLCGIIEERRIKQIYKEIRQYEMEDEWSATI